MYRPTSPSEVISERSDYATIASLVPIIGPITRGAPSPNGNATSRPTILCRNHDTIAVQHHCQNCLAHVCNRKPLSSRLFISERSDNIKWILILRIAKSGFFIMFANETITAYMPRCLLSGSTAAGSCRKRQRNLQKFR